MIYFQGLKVPEIPLKLHNFTALFAKESIFVLQLSFYFTTV